MLREPQNAETASVPKAGDGAVDFQRIGVLARIMTTSNRLNPQGKLAHLAGRRRIGGVAGLVNTGCPTATRADAGRITAAFIAGNA